ncbi:MAG: signal peptidase I [Thermaceae bacterium]|nr:signal peptidase I [Thermaceae bacterium]
MLQNPDVVIEKPSFVRYFWLEWLRPIGEALLLALLITTFAFTTVGVLGSSDEPTLHSGERLFVPKYQTWLHRFGIGSFHRGDLVVVRPPSSSPYAVQPLPFLGQLGATFRPFFIKRIVGLPGDRLRMVQGQLYINGKAVNESHTVPYWQAKGQWDQSSSLANSDTWTFRKGQIGEFAVPQGMYFVMGDNRSPGGSEDSRDFGPVALNQIGGRASFMLWPPLTRDTNGHWQLNWHPMRAPQGLQGIR